MKRLKDMTEPELRELLDSMGKQITAVAGVLEVEKPHFALLLFNDPQIAQYACNCERADVIRAMRECADRLEGRQDVPRGDEPAGLGPTHDYPAGQLHGHDEGGLNLAVGTLASVAHLVVRPGARVQGYPTALPPQDRPARASVADGPPGATASVRTSPLRMVLPWPPSVNHYYRAVNGRQILSAEGRAYKLRVSNLHLRSKPFDGDVAVRMEFYRPAKRGDLDNTLKASLDALKGVAFVDDKQVCEIHAIRRDDKIRPRVEVSVWAYEPETS